MRRVFITIIILVLLAVALFLKSRERVHDPIIRNRPLMDWLALLSDDVAFKPDLQSERAEAEETIRSMGTNALPFLLHHIADDPSKSYFPQRLGLGGRTPRRQAVAEGAIQAMLCLGPIANPAVPSLTELAHSTKNPDITIRALQALGCIRTTNTLPTLSAYLTNTNPRLVAAAIISLSGLQDAAHPAVAVIIAHLKDKNDEVAGAAAYALRRFQQDSAVVVPALINAVDDARYEVRSLAVSSLAVFGGAARPAVPTLLRCAQSTNEPFRIRATNALLRIAPEVLTNVPTQ